jgi:hypothetical protein
LGTEVGSPKEVDAAGYIPVRPAYTRLIQNWFIFLVYCVFHHL